MRFFLLVLVFCGVLLGVNPTQPAMMASAELSLAIPNPPAEPNDLLSTLIPTAYLQPSRTATVPPTRTATVTLTLTSSLTPTITPSPTVTPSLTITPIPTITPSLTHTPSLTPTLTFTPTVTLTLPPTSTSIGSPTATSVFDDPNNTPLPTWTAPPPDVATQLNDHYLFGRPISSNGTNWVDRNYPYGNTRGGRLQVHHGVEFVNPQGTPIRAAGSGVVFYAGDDLSTQFGPILNYYGNLVVIQHAATDANGQPLYTLYGHMVRVEVQTGQAVQEGDNIGMVGGTGVALGPHLHMEIRVGDPFNFGATRNPELWLKPFRTYGVLAGRVTDAVGNLLLDVTLTIESRRLTRYAFSYAGTSVNADTVFGENFTMGDLPADWYTITVGEGGRVRFRQLIYIYPDRTTWLNVVLN